LFIYTLFLQSGQKIIIYVVNLWTIKLFKSSHQFCKNSHLGVPTLQIYLQVCEVDTPKYNFYKINIAYDCLQFVHICL